MFNAVVTEHTPVAYELDPIFPVKDDPATLEVIDARYLKDLTIIAYFDDPIFPYAMKEMLNLKENKRLLRLYEASLPSWTIVLA